MRALLCLLCTTLVLALLIAHFLCCIWYAVGHHSGGWVRVKFPQALDPPMDCNSTDFDHEVHGLPSIGQIQSKMGCRDDYGLNRQYLVTFWFTLSLLLAATGPDIMPTNKYEINFMMLFEMVAAVNLAA